MHLLRATRQDNTEALVNEGNFREKLKVHEPLIALIFAAAGIVKATFYNRRKKICRVMPSPCRRPLTVAIALRFSKHHFFSGE